MTQKTITGLFKELTAFHKRRHLSVRASNKECWSVTPHTRDVHLIQVSILYILTCQRFRRKVGGVGGQKSYLDGKVYGTQLVCGTVDSHADPQILTNHQKCSSTASDNTVQRK